MEFRRYTQNDNDVLPQAIAKVFPTLGYQHCCQWKYTDNPAGLALSALAKKADRIVGQIGIIPFRLNLAGREIVAIQEVDVFIEEKERGLFVLFSLAKLRKQIYDQENISFSYGFSMPDTSAIGLKWGKFEKVAAIPRLVKVLNARPFIEKMIPSHALAKLVSNIINIGINVINAKKGKLPKGTSIKLIERFDERFDTFWERIKEDYSITTVRNRKYLNWRYVKPPHANYTIFSLENNKSKEIMGYIVLGRSRRSIPTGQIVDIVTPRLNNAEVTRALIVHAIREFIKQNKALVICWMFPHCHVSPELKRMGFRNREGRGRDLLVEINKPNDKNLPHKIILKKESWYVTIGDSDYI